MPCPHCKEKINICTSCAYSQEDEFVRCPQCNKIVEYCAHCGTKLYVVPNKENEREFDKAFSRVFGYNVNFDTKICPKCGKEIKYCARCGRSFDIKPAYCMKDKALKIIGYIAIFLIVIGVLYLMYYDYVMGQ